MKAEAVWVSLLLFFCRTFDCRDGAKQGREEWQSESDYFQHSFKKEGDGSLWAADRPALVEI